MVAEENARIRQRGSRKNVGYSGGVVHRTNSAGLADYNIRFYRDDDMDKETFGKFQWYHDYVEPILDPRAIDPCHPFPFLPSLSIALAVELEDAYSNEKFGGFVPSV